MPDIYLLAAVDVRRSKEPGTERKNIISKMAIPSITFQSTSHNPGGSVMSQDFVLPRVEAPEPKFAVKGIDLDAFDGMGIVDDWTFAGAYRKKGVFVPARLLITGAVSMWEPDESDPAEFQGCTHTIKDISRIQFTLDGEELFLIDNETHELRMKGKDIFADVRAALG